MVKFDIDVFKFLSKDHFRVLTGIEMGMKNHELVPTAMIESLANMKRGNCFALIKDLHKHKLVVHNSVPYDGYHLTFRGYDYLAIRAFVMKGIIIGIGKQIGIGKESDVYEAFDSEKRKIVLKLHRLGRISFRKVKEKRDYLKKGGSGGGGGGSWLYLSRLSALKEYSFMKVLDSRGFPVPHAIDVCRHAILMSYINGYPLYHVKKICKPAILYNKCMKLIVLLAKNGLIHCDFNEFNLIVNDKYELILIDFPQMISIQHENSIELFNRDVKCIINFFEKKYNYTNGEFPIIDEKFISTQVETHLDSVVKASGFDIDSINSILESGKKDEDEDDEDDNDDDNEDGNDDEMKMQDNQTLLCKDNESKNEKAATLLCKDNENENESGKNEKHENDKIEMKNDETSQNEKENNESKDWEKIEWERKKLEKRRKFEERRRIKQKLKERKEAILNGTDINDISSDNNDENGKKKSNSVESNDNDKNEFMSKEEIQRRVKKKQKNDERKQKFKRAKKTGQRNKDKAALKKELKNDAWG